jgi:hypothetical protein
MFSSWSQTQHVDDDGVRRRSKRVMIGSLSCRFVMAVVAFHRIRHFCRVVNVAK